MAWTLAAIYKKGWRKPAFFIIYSKNSRIITFAARIIMKRVFSLDL